MRGKTCVECGGPNNTTLPICTICRNRQQYRSRIGESSNPAPKARRSGDAGSSTGGPPKRRPTCAGPAGTCGTSGGYEPPASPDKRAACAAQFFRAGSAAAHSRNAPRASAVRPLFHKSRARFR